MNPSAVSEQTLNVLKEPLPGFLMGRFSKRMKRHQIGVVDRKWGKWLGKCPTKSYASVIDWVGQTDSKNHLGHLKCFLLTWCFHLGNLVSYPDWLREQMIPDWIAKSHIFARPLLYNSLRKKKDQPESKLTLNEYVITKKVIWHVVQPTECRDFLPQPGHSERTPDDLMGWSTPGII